MKRYPFASRSRRFNPFAWVIVLFTAIFALVSKMPGAQVRLDRTPAGAVSQITGLRVVHVTDGDTLRLSNKEKVRLIGIDTPELHENAKLYRDAERSGQDVQTLKGMGQKAYRFTRDLVEGKAVRLELDVQARDKYGRLLAYVYLEDGTFVNAQIIKQGYAYPMTIPPNTRHADEFRALFAEARRSGVGLWAVKDYAKDRHDSSR